MSIGAYNSFVTSAATAVPELSALGTSWTAIASTSSMSARTNTGTTGTGVPIYRLDGTRIADNYADLWDGSIAAPLQIDENGAAVGTPRGVWTGSNQDGSSHPLYELGAASSMQGYANNGGSAWIAWSSFSSGGDARLYGMSGTLTAVPEPGPFTLMALCATSGLVVRWARGRRKRRP